jgi:general stress protein 26
MTFRTTKNAVLEFMRSHSVAAEASVSPSGRPQAAVVGFVVTDDFEVFFDTVDSTRKAANLRQNPSISFVIGGFGVGDERTVQFQGIVDSPGGAELERLKELYFDRFPDGRDRVNWPGLVYLRARPTWIRFSDFSRAPPEIVEFDF